MSIENETTAKTISKNKIKKFSNQTLLVQNDSENSNFLEGFELSIILMREVGMILPQSI